MKQTIKLVDRFGGRVMNRRVFYWAQQGIVWAKAQAPIALLALQGSGRRFSAPTGLASLSLWGGLPLGKATSDANWLASASRLAIFWHGCAFKTIKRERIEIALQKITLFPNSMPSRWQ